MPAQSRKSSSRPTRSQRRAGTAPVRHFAYPATSTPTSAPVAPRRFYSAEPAPVDYTREFGFVRHDLRRILIIAGVLIIVMIALALFKLPL
ncbi:MAG: hypothetical protein H0X37_17890 [Herpetosiphonaceae bacterium]|nr:hypothetical protein [Herpetosiphonaceae bacterium]